MQKHLPGGDSCRSGRNSRTRDPLLDGVQSQGPRNDNQFRRFERPRRGAQHSPTRRGRELDAGRGSIREEPEQSGLQVQKWQRFVQLQRGAGGPGPNRVGRDIGGPDQPHERDADHYGGPVPG